MDRKISTDNLTLFILSIIAQKANFQYFELLFKLLNHFGVFLNLPEYMSYLVQNNYLKKEREGFYTVTNIGKELCHNKSIKDLIFALEKEIDSFNVEKALDFIEKNKVE